LSVQGTLIQQTPQTIQDVQQLLQGALQ
jgi:hypothetical protein